MKTEELHQSLIKIESNLSDLQSARDQVKGLAVISEKVHQSSIDLLKELQQINTSFNNEEEGFLKKIDVSINNFSGTVDETIIKLNELRLLIERIGNLGFEINEPVRKILSIVSELYQEQKYSTQILLDVKTNLGKLPDFFILELSNLEDRFKPGLEAIFSIQEKISEIKAKLNNVLDELSLIRETQQEIQTGLYSLELFVMKISDKLDLLITFINEFQSDFNDKFSILFKSISNIDEKILENSSKLNGILAELSSIKVTQKEIELKIEQSNKQLNNKFIVQSTVILVGFIAIILILFLAK